MKNRFLISAVAIGLAVGTVMATEPDAKELAAKGYATFKGVLAGDEAKLPEAIRYMEESRSADGSNVSNLFNLARAYFFEAITFNREEPLAKAEQTFAKIMELDPKRVDALSFHGSVLTQMSRGGDVAKFMRGVQEMKAAIEQLPNDVTSRIVLSATSRNFPPQALAAMGNYDPTGDTQFVANVFDTFHSDFAPHASVVMNAIAGEDYKQRGDAEKARASFQKALDAPMPTGSGARVGRELLNKVIAARLNGGDKPVFADPAFSGCHSCHLTAPDKLLPR